jgi:DNA-binding MarR family transcriptional regulator
MQASSVLDPTTDDGAIDGLGEAVHALMRAWACLGRHGAESTRSWFSALQMAVLIGPGEHRLTELAQRRGVDQSVISRQIGILQAQGLVSRRPDPADGRASLVRLTADGLALLDDGRALRRNWLRDALAHTPITDVRTATALVTALTTELRRQAAELAPRP